MSPVGDQLARQQGSGHAAAVWLQVSWWCLRTSTTSGLWRSSRLHSNQYGGEGMKALAWRHQIDLHLERYQRFRGPGQAYRGVGRDTTILSMSSLKKALTTGAILMASGRVPIKNLHRAYRRCQDHLPWSGSRNRSKLDVGDKYNDVSRSKFSSETRLMPLKRGVARMQWPPPRNLCESA